MSAQGIVSDDERLVGELQAALRDQAIDKYVSVEEEPPPPPLPPIPPTGLASSAGLEQPFAELMPPQPSPLDGRPPSPST